VTKPKKTRSELAELIMTEVRRHPKGGTIQGVAIMQPTDQN